MSVSVAIANPKGGVGKSLTTMMLADGLALSYGARILVIDADPQAGVTKSLLGIGTLFVGFGQPVFCFLKREREL